MLVAPHVAPDGALVRPDVLRLVNFAEVSGLRAAYGCLKFLQSFNLSPQSLAGWRVGREQ
jgi:hypothetical protein